MATIFDLLQWTGLANIAGSVIGTILDVLSMSLVLVLGSFLSIVDGKP